jgi:hypothetical protein
MRAMSRVRTRYEKHESSFDEVAGFQVRTYNHVLNYSVVSMRSSSKISG